jgi:hypothetical protein
MRASPDSNRAAVTMAPTIGIAAVALVLEFIISNVSDKELNHFYTLLQDEYLLNETN